MSERQAENSEAFRLMSKALKRRYRRRLHGLGVCDPEPIQVAAYLVVAGHEIGMDLTDYGPVGDG